MGAEDPIDRLVQAFKKLMTAVLDTTPSEATDGIQKKMRSITTLFSNFVTLAIYVFLVVWLFQLVTQIINKTGLPCHENNAARWSMAVRAREDLGIRAME